MKDAIRKVIWDNPSVQDSAREIAELMTAFIEWIESTNYKKHSNNMFALWLDDKGVTWQTTDELFTYWKDNVYKKQ